MTLWGGKKKKMRVDVWVKSQSQAWIVDHVYIDVPAVWLRVVVIYWGSVPACSAALVDYIWMLGRGLDPSVCVWQMAPCQQANVTTLIQRRVFVCEWEREKRGAKTKKRAVEEYPLLSHNDEDCNIRPTVQRISSSSSLKGRVFKMWNTSLIHWWWWWWWWQDGGWVEVWLGCPQSVKGKAA